MGKVRWMAGSWPAMVKKWNEISYLMSFHLVTLRDTA